MKIFIFSFCLLAFGTNIHSQNLGVFDGQTDIGKILHSGNAMNNAASGSYEVSGSGTNIWLTHDDFHFVWKKMKGDFILQCRGKLMGKGVEEHRKFGWMIRNTLDSTSAMIATTIHGNGLTSLQYRRLDKTNVEEKKLEISGPDIIQLERRGKLYIMSVAHFGELYVTQQTDSVDLNDEVYVGLFVCAHNKDVIEKAIFDNVRIIIPAKGNFEEYKEYIGSNIETMNVFTGVREVVHTSPKSLQAPNWTKDGSALLYNSEGLIYHFNLKNKSNIVLNTGSVKENNNDHVIAFNGKILGLSAASLDGKYNSVVYTVPISGGEPKQITPIGLSYLHGWSPDGKWLTFVGMRNNDFDIYKILSSGSGQEIQLTKSPGLDDGPEYSPDGKYIYFNSVRSGHMQLYRMKPDGSEQTQLTSDTLNNWFPHISPDGKWIVCITFMNDVKPDQHLFYKHVYLRMMPAAGGPLKVIAYLYGGQGTINTPSWSPDSNKIAFVSNSDMKK